MLNVAGVSLETAVRLGTHGVRTAEDLAGLMPDEYRFIFMDIETEVKLDDLFDMADHEISRLVRQSPVTAEEANKVIMAARVAVYGDEVIAPEPEPEPPTPGPGDLAAPAPCGPIGSIPADATITGDLLVDVDADGVADDRLIGYETAGGDWYLRAVVDGVGSELALAGDAWPHGVVPLGLADLGAITPGPEILAVVGGGASGKNLGIFGLDADDCLFRFTIFGGGPLDVYIGATVNFLDTFGCLGEPNVFGTVGFWTANYVNHAENDWTGSSAAFAETAPGDFTYIPASDDFSEGLTVDDLPNDMFDCPGVTHP